MKRKITLRLGLPLSVTMTLLLAAGFTGSPVFLTPALLGILMILTSLLGVHRASATLKVISEVTSSLVYRGDDVELRVTVTYQGLLPIAPVTLELSALPDQPAQVIRLNEMKGKRQTLVLPFHASHVGVSRPGVEAVTVCDLFGMFSIRKIPEKAGEELLVLPLVFDVEPMPFSPGDAGSETMARAAEDNTEPSDVRSYQPGDPMKKIHWKLSARKQELLVRRFEDPVLQDALVLMDCAAPPQRETAEKTADLQDALVETAASVMVQMDRTDHPAKLPIYGRHPMELDKRMGLPMVLENLARADFSNLDRFERMLMLETRRLRTVGCTVVISARLSSVIVDVLRSMRRMGPAVRFYFVTPDPEAAETLPLIHNLQEAGVEVAYVKPLPQ